MKLLQNIDAIYLSTWCHIYAALHYRNSCS